MKAMNRTRVLAAALAWMVISGAASSQSAPATEKKAMDLGNFSVSLNVKDIKASMAFYEKLDFKVVAGKLEQKWIDDTQAKLGGASQKDILKKRFEAMR